MGGWCSLSPVVRHAHMKYSVHYLTVEFTLHHPPTPTLPHEGGGSQTEFLVSCLGRNNRVQVQPICQIAIR